MVCIIKSLPLKEKSRNFHLNLKHWYSMKLYYKWDYSIIHINLFYPEIRSSFIIL